MHNFFNPPTAPVVSNEVLPKAAADEDTAQGKHAADVVAADIAPRGVGQLVGTINAQGAIIEFVSYQSDRVLIPLSLFDELIEHRGYITAQEIAELQPHQPFDSSKWMVSMASPDIFILRAPAHDAADAKFTAKMPLTLQDQ